MLSLSIGARRRFASRASTRVEREVSPEAIGKTVVSVHALVVQVPAHDFKVKLSVGDRSVKG